MLCGFKHSNFSILLKKKKQYYYPTPLSWDGKASPLKVTIVYFIIQIGKVLCRDLPNYFCHSIKHLFEHYEIFQSQAQCRISAIYLEGATMRKYGPKHL